MRHESVLIIRAWVEPATNEPRARIFELLPDDSVKESATDRISGVMDAVESWLSRLTEGNEAATLSPTNRRDT